MNFPPYQARVAEFVSAHDLDASVEVRVLDLTSEVGELAKEVLKANRYGHAPFAPNEAWADELADVFFALVCLANSTQVNLDEALTAALKNIKPAWPREVTPVQRHLPRRTLERLCPPSPPPTLLKI